MQLRERAPVGSLLVILVLGTVVLAASHATRVTKHALSIVEQPELASTPVIVVTGNTITYRRSIPIDTMELTIPEADAAYRRHAFGEAARIARTCAESDSRLGATAELYWQFANAYYTGFDPGGAHTKRYEALREAKKLDVVLGGQFVDEIEHRLAELAPKAAIAYAARREYDDAALACAVAESIGLYDDPNVQAVRRKLRAEHR